MKQIAVVAENKPGIVADISTALSRANVNIDSIEAGSVGKMGLIRLTVSDENLVLKVLMDKGYNAVTEEVVLVRLKDKPGELASVARKFKDADINITNLRLIERDGEFSIAAISCEDMQQARKILGDRLVS